MSVQKVENGVVVQRWDDVDSLHDFRLKYGLTGPDYIEGDGRPGQTWDGSAFSDPPPPPLSVADVAREANRRIRAIVSDQGREAMQARGLELAMKRLDGQELSPGEQAEREAAERIWDAVRAIRATEAEMREMDPIPADYADDGRWP